MRTIRTVSELRTALARHRREEATIGLVPTMGALHDGHLALMRRAREECDVLVVSLFVNPAQFNEASDLDAYPRDEYRDAELAGDVGADFLFAPAVQEVYPSGFSTRVVVDGISDRLEGTSRGRAHFDGVATVVCKLFGMVGPEVAYFGQKDFQQTLVIRRLVADLDIPVRIEVCPTVREPDGLALSSRNARLDPVARERATALRRALLAADAAVIEGERDPGEVIARAANELLKDGIELEYFELATAEQLLPIERVQGRVIALVAARVGGIRLIDNHLLSVESAGADSIASWPGGQLAGVQPPRASTPTSNRS
ncbi:MAG: pantoate--beta-alanine ligase [Solirubrobacteraceae bacterium]